MPRRVKTAANPMRDRRFRASNTDGEARANALLAYALHPFRQFATMTIASFAPRIPVSHVHAAAVSVHASSNRAPALIVARGLSKTYSTADSGQVLALQNLDFEIF